MTLNPSEHAILVQVAATLESLGKAFTYNVTPTLFAGHHLYTVYADDDQVCCCHISDVASRVSSYVSIQKSLYSSRRALLSLS